MSDDIELIYRRFSDACRKTASSILRDDEAAADIVHEVFFRIHQRLSRHADGAGRVSKAYVVRATINACYDARRYSIRYSRVPGNSEMYPSHNETPEDRVAQVELAHAIACAIDHLPPGCRQVWTLKLRGHTHSEIAATLGIRVKAVEKQIQRGRSFLKPCLESFWTDSNESSTKGDGGDLAWNRFLSRKDSSPTTEAAVHWKRVAAVTTLLGISLLPKTSSAEIGNGCGTVQNVSKTVGGEVQYGHHFSTTEFPWSDLGEPEANHNNRHGEVAEGLHNHDDHPTPCTGGN